MLAETMVKAQARGENVLQLIMTPPSPQALDYKRRDGATSPLRGEECSPF